MEFKDYYQTLGVGRSAEPDEIKRSYRRLARKYHPDVSKEPEAEQRFKEIQEAHEVLKDPEKRAAYDQFGANWKAGQKFHPPPDWEPGVDFAGGAFPISRSRAHTHRRHGHPLQTVPSAGLIERPQEKNRVDALR